MLARLLHLAALGLLSCASCAGPCSRRAPAPAPRTSQDPPPLQAPPPDAASAPAPAAASNGERQQLAPGLTVERARAAIDADARAGDGAVLFVRIDPHRYAPRVLTAAEHGAARTAPAWANDFGLTAVINTSMYGTDGRSVSLLVDDGHANSTRDDRRYGGLLGLRPRRPDLPAARILDRSCPGGDVDALRSDYRLVIANYRLLDCAGAPIAWSDAKAYSAAAIGLDREGNVVLVHSRTPYRMRDFARWLASPEHRLTAAVYVEGGPEASVFVRAGGQVVEAIGSYETGFREDDSNTSFWEIPNVLGFTAR
jgi:hypothetical protein